MNFARFVLGVMGLAFAVVAGLGWFAPSVLLGPVGVGFTEAAGTAEVRAAYGGLFGASSLLFLRAAARPEHAEPALRWAILVLSGFVFGRLVSLALDGVPAWPAWAALVSECNGLIASLVALRRISKATAPTP